MLMRTQIDIPDSGLNILIIITHGGDYTVKSVPLILDVMPLRI